MIAFLDSATYSAYRSSAARFATRSIFQLSERMPGDVVMRLNLISLCSGSLLSARNFAVISSVMRLYE